MITLNVNIDHIATIRNARGGVEPEPVAAALIAENAGATGIVSHLREDRRHVKDRDLKLLRELIQTKLDLEMGANEEIIGIALDTVPDLVTIVPENRMELTTEGGLNVAEDMMRFKNLVDRMHEKEIEVSFFIEPLIEQIDSVLAAGGDMVEFHTGIYANAKAAGVINLEFKRIKKAAEYAKAEGLQIAAGHGLNYFNTQKICTIPEIDELSIGHSIISHAVFTGLERAVKDMLDLINYSVIESKR
jgi:pyridoxine 5-phosphate synthase